MKITTEQLLDIKCILGRVKKNQVAKELGVNSVDLSRPISNKNLIDRLDTYFDRIDPEINIVCNKFQDDDIWQVSENKPLYRKSDSGMLGADPQFLIKMIDIQEKNIKHLEDDVWALKKDIQRIAKVYPDILDDQFGLSCLSKTG